MTHSPHYARKRTYLFPFLATLVFLLFHLLVYWGLLVTSSPFVGVQNALKIFICLNFLATACYIFFRQSPIIPQWLYLLLSISVGVIFSLFVFMIFYQFLALLGRWIISSEQVSQVSNGKENIYLGYLQLIIIALSMIYVIYGIYKGRARPFLQKITLPIPHLKIPLKVIQLSDIHIGKLMQKPHICQIVQMVNEQKPDIIVLTGDIIDTYAHNACAALQALKDLQAVYGVYYVLGNHEYFYDTPNIIEQIQTLGFHTLINQNITISQDNTPLITIIGLADLMGERMDYLPPDIHQAFDGINTSLPTILLSHQPKIIKKLQDKAINLILSGHTHGGQLSPFGLAVLLDQPFLMGLHKLCEDQYLYINQGTGFWGPPMRVGTRAEITSIQLLPK
ncbi:hypothetical protein BKH46_02290 [Helicobacter sp. 12S02634-8]|uniref:metallophosphoesterase n=1 Tax=Helicobacter sp. 12S02634-8 TaxID=1476199 RepID=UPI000BA5D76E|nr:metallophosphoesterase [Helicobacter sp. 12S02634-8]PAF48157.1 hypothetical protein BKH46_02290 [Helicobacter sp. 12S02634-8]